MYIWDGIGRGTGDSSAAWSGACRTLTRAGDEEQDQAVPHLALLVADCRAHLHDKDDAKWIFSLRAHFSGQRKFRTAKRKTSSLVYPFGASSSHIWSHDQPCSRR